MATTLATKPPITQLVTRLNRATAKTTHTITALEQVSTELGLTWPTDGTKVGPGDKADRGPLLYEVLEAATLQAERNLERLAYQTDLLGGAVGLTEAEDEATDIG